MLLAAAALLLAAGTGWMLAAGAGGGLVGTVLAFPVIVLTLVVAWLTLAVTVRGVRGQLDLAASQKHGKGDRRTRIREIRGQQIKRGLKPSLERMAAEIPVALVHDPTLVQAEFRTDDSAAGAEVPLAAAFRKANGRLLIAGAPGSGKTTLALELMSDLLDEAARDEEAGIPVLFKLGNWPGEQKPIADWLRDEMKLQGWGPSWVNAREIILILDGLDEVNAERRSACLKAISVFRDHYEGQSIVVTCRVDDYRRLIQDAPKLAFGAAYVTRPLSVSQVCDYLAAAGPTWESVRTAIERGDSPALAELFSTPLLLAVATVAYAGRDASGLLTSEVTLDRLWSEYVKVMRTRRLDPRHPEPENPDTDVLRAQHGPPPSEHDVRQWLGWLALSTAAVGRQDIWLHLLGPPQPAALLSGRNESPSRLPSD